MGNTPSPVSDLVTALMANIELSESFSGHNSRFKELVSKVKDAKKRVSGSSAKEVVDLFEGVFDFAELSSKSANNFLGSLNGFVLFPLIRKLQGDSRTRHVANYLIGSGVNRSLKDLGSLIAPLLSGGSSQLDVIFALVYGVNIVALLLALRNPGVTKQESDAVIKLFNSKGFSLSKSEIKDVIRESNSNLDRNSRLSILLSFFGKSLNDFPVLDKRGKASLKRDYAGVSISNGELVDYLCSLFFVGEPVNKKQVSAFNDFKGALKRVVSDNLIFDGSLFKVATSIDDYFRVWYKEAPADFSLMLNRLCNKLYSNYYEPGYYDKLVKSGHDGSVNVLVKLVSERGFSDGFNFYELYLKSVIVVTAFFDAFFDFKDVFVLTGSGDLKKATDMVGKGFKRVSGAISDGNKIVDSLWREAFKLAKSSGLTLAKKNPVLPNISIFDYYNIISILSINADYTSPKFNSLLYGDVLLKNRLYTKVDALSDFKGFSDGLFDNCKKFFIECFSLSSELFDGITDVNGVLAKSGGKLVVDAFSKLSGSDYDLKALGAVDYFVADGIAARVKDLPGIPLGSGKAPVKA